MFSTPARFQSICRWWALVFSQGETLLDLDFQRDLPDWAKQLAVFDLETTGLDLTSSRIVTACVAVVGPSGEVSQLHEWLVNPGIEIPAAATSVHGITTEKAIAEGLAAESAIPEIVEKLNLLNRSMPLVAFNAPYDFTILQNEALRHGTSALRPNPVIDPLVIDRKLRFGAGKRNLISLCEIYGVKFTDAHNSTADALAAGKIALAQAAKYAELNQAASKVHDLQIKWSEAWTRNFHDWLEKENRPVDRAEIGWPIRAS
jgi:DNA polymerase III subunit epsilon